MTPVARRLERQASGSKARDTSPSASTPRSRCLSTGSRGSRRSVGHVSLTTASLKFVSQAQPEAPVVLLNLATRRRISDAAANSPRLSSPASRSVNRMVRAAEKKGELRYSEPLTPSNTTPRKRSGMHTAEGYGWRPGKIEHEWKPLMEKKRAEMSRLNGIYSNILKNANVEVMEGFGKVVDKHTVQIGDKKVTAGTILIATGAKPHMIDFPGKEYAISSDELLNIEERPAKMVVFGAGYIACEMACILAGYRTEAHVVYRAEHPLRGFDNDCRKFVAEQMEVNGVHLHPSRVPVSIEAKDKKYSVTIKSNKDGSTEVITDVDVVLMATGRAPNVDGLGLEQVGVEMSDDKSIK
eukprot:gene13658-21007_t